MSRKTIVLAIVGMWFAAFVYPAQGCSLLYSISDRPDRLVMIASITDYVAEDWSDATVYGVSVEPAEIYQSPRPGQGDEYVFFPYALGADCSRNFDQTDAGFKSEYPVGRLVAVYSIFSGDHGPGGSAAFWADNVRLLPTWCTPESVERIKPDYVGFGAACGDALFHVYRELAGIRQRPVEERVEFFERLTNSEIAMNYGELVSRYIDDRAAREQLMQRRYGDVITLGCETRPEIRGDDQGELRRSEMLLSLWYEYCSDRGD